MENVKNFIKSLGRRKSMDFNLSETKLNRCLSTLDLTALGISSVLGVGIYVLTGQVASVTAGPAVIISFLIAAISCILSALCYAELGTCIPVAGSAYVYSYVIIGELMAFVVGWNIFFTFIVGSASLARGYSAYLDIVFDGAIQRNLQEVMPINVTGMTAYPDFLALSITLLAGIILTIGVKTSSWLNKIFVTINLIVVIFAVVIGATKCNIDNWKLNKTSNKIPANAGEGGFFPFGFSGVVDGAAICFFGFLGFDSMATAGEEAKNPQKAIPISIIATFCCVFLAYLGISVVQTLMVPYYLQNKPAPLPFVFDQVDLGYAKWFITVGALIALSMSVLGPLYTVTRILYAMGNDGVIFSFFAKVNLRSKTPLIATLFASVLAGCMATMFEINALSRMVAISSLLSHTLVAICILIFRYETGKAKNLHRQSQVADNTIVHGTHLCDNLANPPKLMTLVGKSNIKDIFQQLVNANGVKEPTEKTTKNSYILISTMCCLITVLCAIMSCGEQYLLTMNIVILTATVFIIFLLLLSIFMLYKQPMARKESFEVPLVPFIPILSIFVNIYFMFKLPIFTWKHFGIWMSIGFCIYFSYGVWNSTRRHTVNKELKCEDQYETRL